MRIAKTDVSFIDGKGIAYVIYFQGCSLRCKGCHNPFLQDYKGGYDITEDRILFDIDPEFYDSVVFLGGEALDQPSAVYNLADQIGIEKWLYTGYELDDVPEEIKKRFDVIVAGPYVESLRTDGFPASSNQQVYRRES